MPTLAQDATLKPSPQSCSHWRKDVVQPLCEASLCHAVINALHPGNKKKDNLK